MGRKPCRRREAIWANYQVRDVQDDMVIDTICQVLQGVARQSAYGDKATMPLTLLVIDELQQYLGDDVQLLLEMQDIIERLTRQFEGRLLVVAAGQSALTANEMLARFQDRFTVQVQLQSRDVETVDAKVVLRKDPVRFLQLSQAIDSVSGEIARHLGGSKLAAHPAHQPRPCAHRTIPCCPPGGGLWRVHGALFDRGAAGQLRSQLLPTVEAVGQVARRLLGTVVPGDVIFRSKKEDMLNQGVVLFHQLGDRIAAVRDGSPDGDMRARATEMVFLISQLDETQGFAPERRHARRPDGHRSQRRRPPARRAPAARNLFPWSRSSRLGRRGLPAAEPTDAEWNRAFKERRQAYLINTAEQLQVREDAIKSRLQTERRRP